MKLKNATYVFIVRKSTRSRFLIAKRDATDVIGCIAMVQTVGPRIIAITRCGVNFTYQIEYIRLYDLQGIWQLSYHRSQ